MSRTTVKVPFKLEASQNIGYVLSELKSGVRNRALRHAMRKVASRASKAQKSAVDDDRELKKSIGWHVRKYRKGDTYFAIAGPRHGHKKTLTIPTPDGKGSMTITRNPVAYGWITDAGRKAVQPKRKKVLTIPEITDGNFDYWYFPRSVSSTKADRFIDPGREEMRRWAAEFLGQEFMHQLNLIEIKELSKGKSIYRKR